MLSVLPQHIFHIRNGNPFDLFAAGRAVLRQEQVNVIDHTAFIGILNLQLVCLGTGKILFDFFQHILKRLRQDDIHRISDLVYVFCYGLAAVQDRLSRVRF